MMQFNAKRVTSGSFRLSLIKNQTMSCFLVVLCVLSFSFGQAQLIQSDFETEGTQLHQPLSTPDSPTSKAFVPAFTSNHVPESPEQVREPVSQPEVEESDQKQEIKQQDTSPITNQEDVKQTLTVDELRQLLHDMNQEEKFAQDEELDDHTLLDIFGEVAKEYLTQKVVRAIRES